MAIKILTLEGLQDSKLCDLLAKLLETVPGVDSARIDFLSRKLTLDLNSKNTAATVDDVIALMRKTFPNVTAKRVEVGADTPPPPERPARRYEPIDPLPEYQYGREDLEELDAPEKEEAPAQREGKEEKQKAERVISAKALRGIFSLGGFGIALLLFIISLFLPYEGFSRELLISFAFFFSAASSLIIFTVKGCLELRILAVMTAVISLAALLVGRRTEALVSMLVCQAGLVAAAWLHDSLERSAADCIDILPDTVLLVQDGHSRPVPLRQILPGCQVMVMDGMTLPFDGFIREGVSELDRSLFSGSKKPVHVEPGEPVFCGEINLKNPVTIEVSCLQEATSAWKLRELFLNRERQGHGLPRKWTVLLFATLGLLTIGTAAFILWGKAAEQWINPMLLLLLNAAPCGAFMAAEVIRQSSLLQGLREGIYLNGGQSAEDIVLTDTIVSGFRGVLTQGEYHLRSLEPSDDYSENELLRIAAFVESESGHPIAKLILEKYYEEYPNLPIPRDRITMFEEVSGGVRAMIERKVTFAGDEQLMLEMGVEVPPNYTGGTCVYVAVRGEYVGRIIFDDEMKPGAENLTAALRQAGSFHTVLLSACDDSVIRTTADLLEFDEVFAGQDSSGKGRVMETLISQAALRKQQLLYMGDGSDAGLFSAPCVRVLLGTKKMAALLGIADAIIPSGDPSKVAEAIRLCRGTGHMAAVSIFGSYALKWILLGCSIFFSLPLYTAVIVNVLPSVALLLFAYIRIRYAVRDSANEEEAAA